MLIFSPLSPSQKSVRLIRADNKRTQLCLQTELAEKITITSLTEATAVSTTNVGHERKNHYS